MKSVLCAYCKKPIDQNNHFTLTRTVYEGLMGRFGKPSRQNFEFHSLTEVKAWIGHRPKGED